MRAIIMRQNAVDVSLISRFPFCKAIMVAFPSQTGKGRVLTTNRCEVHNMVMV